MALESAISVAKNRVAAIRTATRKCSANGRGPTGKPRGAGPTEGSTTLGVLPTDGVVRPINGNIDGSGPLREDHADSTDLIDLSEQAHRNVCGYGTCEVTVR